MATDYAHLLNPDRALVFRIIHRANLPWVLQHGLHCGNSATQCPGWISIGNQELISKRARWPVPVAPGGVLNDYVPFYFTPFSPMMLAIKTGYNGVQQYPPQDIVILVSDLRRIAAQGLTWLFTDTHANNVVVNYFKQLADLTRLDWRILQARDFLRDADDPAKFGRYQAEALVHRHCPLQALSGIVCFDDHGKMTAQQAVDAHGATLKVVKQPSWYL
jgi:hypothetical protein